MDVPMLDEAEFAIISQLHSDSMRATREFREKYGLSLGALSIEQRFSPVCQKYLETTGFKETNANAVMHHRISLYGPPCSNCGKPLRNNEASFCASCGYAVKSN
jgi:hypothetical protein